MIGYRDNVENKRRKALLYSIVKYLNWKNTVYCVVFFFLSLAGWFQMPGIFCVCCLIAACAHGEAPHAAIIGIIIGCVFQRAWGVQVLWWNAISAGSLLLLRDYKWPKGMGLAGITMLILLPGSVISGIAWQFTVQEWILTALMYVLACGSMPAISKAAEWILLPAHRKEHTDNALYTMIPLIVLLIGMAKTRISVLNFGYAASVFFLLISAGIFPLAAAMSIGFMCGMALLFDGHGIYWLLTLPLMGAFGVMLRGKRKWVSAVMSILVCLTTAYILSGELHIAPVVCTIAGSAVWMVFPSKYLKSYTIAMQKTSLIKKADNPYLAQKLQALTESMEKLSNAIPQPVLSITAPEALAEIMMENLCENCDRVLICWRDHYAERKAQFIEMAEQILVNGEQEYALSGCIDPAGLKTEAKKYLIQQQEKLRRFHQVCYEQEMLHTHFAAIGEIVNRRIEDGIRDGGEERYQEMQIVELLEYIHFPATVQYIKLTEGHYSLMLKSSKQIGNTQTAFLEKHISQRIGRKMELFSNENGQLLFEEIPAYCVKRGVATACAVSAARKDITPYAVENGDAVTAQTVRCGLEMTALSDGMGHGKGAGNESRKTLELLSVCLEAGYTSEQAIRAVNGMMLSATGGERFATVDMCMIDLWNGHTTLHKLGANLSLIIQGQNIRAVEGEALPLGIIEHIIPMKHEMDLGAGDMVLLFSDGVTDAFETEDALTTLIHRYYHLSPQEIADGMLQDALIQSGGLPADDMTVVCIRIEQRKRNRR